MSEQVNVILAPMAGRMGCTTNPVYRYNSGMILKLIGIDLPTSYVVDFANSVTGTSISQVGGTDGVHIPDQFFVPGSTIHAWYVAVGTDYAVTRYHIVIPISPRAVRTNDEPTPSQESALDQAISALNGAVEHSPKIENGYWYVWDASTGAWVNTGVQAEGQNGVSPTVSFARFEDRTLIYFTDAEGTKTVTIYDGRPGVSPTIVSTDIPNGHRLTITDRDHPTGYTVDVMNGENGDPGTPGTNAYVWIRYSATEPTQDSDMSTTPGPWLGIYSGNAASAPTHYTDYAWYKIKGETPTVPVNDVQVNGSSVLQNGVANVPAADANTYGVVKNGSSLAIDGNGRLNVNNASDSGIKAGTSTASVLIPARQHLATFYGLAKAAGDSSQSASSNAVGVYTEEALAKIQKMLGIYQAPWELIMEDTFTNVTQADYAITADGNNQAFELTSAILIINSDTSEAASKVTGDVRFYYDDNAYYITTFVGWDIASGAQNQYGMAEIDQKDGLIIAFSRYARGASSINTYGAMIREENNTGMNYWLSQAVMSFKKIIVRNCTGTFHYRLIGKRKWTA